MTTDNLDKWRHSDLVAEVKELRTQLTALQAANKVKTDSLIHLIDALKSSGFIIRQQDLDARTINGNAALDAITLELRTQLAAAQEQIRITYGDLQHYVTRSDELARKLAAAQAAIVEVTGMELHDRRALDAVTKPLVDALKFLQRHTDRGNREFIAKTLKENEL